MDYRQKITQFQTGYLVFIKRVKNMQTLDLVACSYSYEFSELWTLIKTLYRQDTEVAWELFYIHDPKVRHQNVQDTALIADA